MLPEVTPAPPGLAQDTMSWWRSAARHFESRARRAELTQSFAVNVADSERDARISNAVTQTTCAQELQERDSPAAASAPVG